LKGIYIVGGYPDMRTFVKEVDIISKLGLDFIEIGIPFSEPVADGPVISSAIHDSIEGGMTTNKILDFVKTVDRKVIKVYIMTYSNIIFSYGLEKFSKDFGKFINSVIIADLPNRMHSFFYEKGFTIPIIPFVTPETRVEDMKLLKEKKGDFIYFIGIRGVTGGNMNSKKDEVASKIAELRKFTKKKIILGFGLKNRDDALEALKIADGYVVGTEAVKRQKEPDLFEQFIFNIIK